ncbi:hypothetical protein C8R44DRAFT_746935 [Mycena epipterygia]|nr:hypothetical protein C8R44DRAFT_746935 [Mycena epipterygia]
MIKVGKVEFVPYGVDGNSQLKRTKVPSGELAEEYIEYHLSRHKDDDGEDIQFGEGWTLDQIDRWLRGLFSESFEYLDIIYGSEESHWILVKKDRQKIFIVKRETYTGADLVGAKGTSARGWRDCVVRIVSRHTIPAVAYKDWSTAIEKAKAGDRKSKGKTKRSSPSPESEEALSSESEGNSGDEGSVVVKPETEISEEVPRRCSSRFASISSDDTAGVQIDPDVDVAKPPSRRSSKSSLSSATDLFLPEDSELEFEPESVNLELNGEPMNEEWELGEDQWANLDDETWYARFQSRKRSSTITSNISEREDRKKLKASNVTDPDQYDETSVPEPNSDLGASSAHIPGAGSAHVPPVASVPTSSNSVSTNPIVPNSAPGPSRHVYVPPPKRGFNVPEATSNPLHFARVLITTDFARNFGLADFARNFEPPHCAFAGSVEFPQWRKYEFGISCARGNKCAFGHSYAILCSPLMKLHGNPQMKVAYRDLSVLESHKYQNNLRQEQTRGSGCVPSDCALVERFAAVNIESRGRRQIAYLWRGNSEITDK